MEKYIIEDNSNEQGKRFIYQFPNGYGASVIQNLMSYGADMGPWDVAVLKFQADGLYPDFTIILTNDVIACSDFNEVENALQQIKNRDNEGCT